MKPASLVRFATGADFYFLTVASMVRLARWLAPLGLRRPLVLAVSATAYRLSRRKRRRSAQGVTAALGASVAPRAVERIVRRGFDMYWDDTISMLPTAADMARTVEADMRGLDRLRDALRRGAGVILWESSMFGRRMEAKRLLRAAGVRVQQVHSEYHLGGLYTGPNPHSWLRRRVLNPLFDSYERLSVDSIVTLPKSDSLAFAREMLERLRRNEVLCIAGDAQVGRRLLSVPLLGSRRHLSAGMLSLARQTGATILPMFCFRDDDGRTILTIDSAIVPDAAPVRGGVPPGLLRFAELLESYVRTHPGEYRDWPSFAPRDQRPAAQHTE